MLPIFNAFSYIKCIPFNEEFVPLHSNAVALCINVSVDVLMYRKLYTSVTEMNSICK